MSFFELVEPEVYNMFQTYLKPLTFPKGACLMRQGSPGDGCYFIDSGEIRLELRDVETDSENVLCYLEAGTVVGEFNLLSDEPRTASAFAQVDTEVRWLSKNDFNEICQKKPEVGVAILRAFGLKLVKKLVHQNQKFSEFMFEDRFDNKTQSIVKKAVLAQKEFARWSEERVDAILRDIAQTIDEQAKSLAEMNVAEVGMGVVEDKIRKIQFACREVSKHLIGRKGAGFLEIDNSQQVFEIASPVGVVFGIIPVTNPVSTIIFKTLICLKGRNALIYSPHHDCLHLGNVVGELIQKVLAQHQAPEGLIQWINERTNRKTTTMFMRHPDVSLILATGGPSIVRTAHRSGKPTIGVSAGNAPVLICADADLPAAAEMIITGKSFDNGIICGSENNLVVVESIYNEFVSQLKEKGAAILSPDEVYRLSTLIFERGNGRLKKEFVGKSVGDIWKLIGLESLVTPRLLIIPLSVKEALSPLAHEKLVPILSLFSVPDEESGFSLCKQILEQEGIGHTAVIHTTNERTARRFAESMPASRILANTSAALGCMGIGTALTPSLTLGCGTFAGNSTTDNVTYTNLLNIKRLAWGL